MKPLAPLLDILVVTFLSFARVQAGELGSLPPSADRVRMLKHVLGAHEHQWTPYTRAGPKPLLMMTWFHNGDPRDVRWSVVDSEGRTREYQEDLFMGKSHGIRGRGLDPAPIANLQELQTSLNRLPAEPKVRPAEGRWLLLSFAQRSEWKTRVYDRGDLPAELETVFKLAKAHVARWLPTVQPLRTIGVSNDVNALALSPDGRILAAGDQNSMVRLWDARDGKDILRIDEHFQSAVKAVIFLPDGKSLVAASETRIVVNDTATGSKKLDWYVRDAYVWSAAVSQDGKTLATGGRPLVLWDLATGKELGRFGEQSNLVWSVTLSPDGKLLAAGGEDDIVRVWNLATRGITANLRQTKPTIGVAFDPDGSRLAVAASDFSLHFTIWDVAKWGDSGTLECPTDNYTEGASAIAWSQDGRLLAIGAANGWIQLWQSQPAKPLAVLGEYSSRVTKLVFFPDGRTLASSSTHGTIKLWDLAQFTSEGHE
jgi:WD40 repeat protein